MLPMTGALALPETSGIVTEERAFSRMGSPTWRTACVYREWIYKEQNNKQKCTHWVTVVKFLAVECKHTEEVLLKQLY